VDTIDGWFLIQKSDAQVVVDAEVEAEGYVFNVHEVDGYHIIYLKVKKVKSSLS
jgi:CBS domain containing-hemolysin-like protein